MVNGRINTALRQVARVFHEGTLTGLSDRQILERFVDRRDEAAFEALMVRHGPMVLNVCRQLLLDPHDVEDAFQAVFLVLVRKARGIRVEGSLGPWLYTVSNRVAARARANRRRLGTREISAAVERSKSTADRTLDRLEAAGVIHEELDRLPERLRAPVVLCYLQGLTHELAAGQLGCPVGTVRSRLSRARAQLLIRITRRGLTLSAAGLVSALDSNARAAEIPPMLQTRLIKSAIRSVSETASTVGGLGVSASVATLLEGVVNAMRIKKLAITAAGLVTLGTLSLVIANRAAAVGGSPYQESVPRGDERQLGPDGRPIGARQTNRRTRFVTQTYYVGDILGVGKGIAIRPTQVSVPGRPATEVQPLVDMKPLTDFIASTVAPGTWQTSRQHLNIETETSDGNVMVPFHLSISLIIRGTSEVHDQVANTLRGLRVLLEARDERTLPSPAEPSKSPQVVNAEPASPTRRTALPPIPAPADPTLPAPLAPQNIPTQPEWRQRVRQLLDELQKEVEKLPRVES
jgi:RNA polymerase sigma factor (sigma-70 family)